MSNVALLIEELSTRWMQAWIDLDYDALESLMAPDFALIVSAMPGGQMERATWLATCERYRCTDFRYDGVQVRQLSDETAVMSAVAEQKATLAGVDRSGKFWLTDVWRRNDVEQWQVCARYSSIPEAHGQSASALAQLKRV